MKYFGDKISATVAFFNRDSDNLIDYTKENEEDKWQSNNLKSLNTKGVELQLNKPFDLFGYKQNIRFGYTYIEENLGSVRANFSKYILNALNHHFIAQLKTQFSKNTSQSILYKFAERATGQSYSVIDAQFKLKIINLELTVTANNLFNTSYIETGIVPMPKGNLLFGLRTFF